MAVSVFEIFKIGIGPSSSHTGGPMKAAGRFIRALAADGRLGAVTRVTVELFGSLALTGRGHGTDRAVLLGLLGETPEDVAVDGIAAKIEALRHEGRLPLLGRRPVDFIEERDLLFHRDQSLPCHPNGMRLEAFDGDGRSLAVDEFYSVGGGFVVTAAEWKQPPSPGPAVPFAYSSAAQLLAFGRSHGMTIAAMQRTNEEAIRPAAEVDSGLRRIWEVMQDCVQRGLTREGELAGGLPMRRRAAQLRQRLEGRAAGADPLAALEWVNAFALAVAEENAAGGRVVTAPTNGAAGIVPAVAHYLWRFVPAASEAQIFTFLLTAAAIGSLYKENASISGAEVGCQGEVGVACSMAAAGLAAALGGSNEQVENAAEIGMEHHLGLTCDPVGGLVQVPCIERNAIAAATAINAACISLAGDGRHLVSLDTVVATMRQTGADMQAKYKETSLGGLAANVVEC